MGSSKVLGNAAFNVLKAQTMENSGNLSVSGTTSATDEFTGALTCAGGMSCEGEFYSGGDVNAGGNLIANSVIVGSLPPASAAATGTVGTITFDANYIYVCVATNTWKRVAIATW